MKRKKISGLFVSADNATEHPAKTCLTAIASFIFFLSLSCLIAAASFFPDSAAAGINYDTGTLQFESTNQSIWGAGPAFAKQGSAFLGTSWSNRTATIGGISGSENEVVIPATDAITVPIWEPKIRIWTPWGGYTRGCGCYKQVTIKPATGAVTADTRTGTELKIHSSGKVGLKFGYTVDSGSIDSHVDFSAKADLPTLVKPAEFFDISTSSIFSNGSIRTQSPRIEAYVSPVLELSGSLDGTACALTFGCASGNKALPDIHMDQRIVSFDPNSVKILDGVLPGDKPFAQIPLLNQSLTLEGGTGTTGVGFKLTGPYGSTIKSTLPDSPSVSVDLAEITVQVPDIETSGSGANDRIVSRHRDDLLSMSMDIDGAATFFGGLPPAGINFTLIDADPFKLEASLALVDADAGLVMGIAQDFEMIPTLMTTIEFTKPVQISGTQGLQSSWTGPWDELPEFALSEATTFSPTFWIDAILKNNLDIDLGLEGTLDILKLGATGSVAGADILEFGPLSLNDVLGIGNTLFETDKIDFPIFNDQIKLEGFGTIEGNPFTITVSPVPVPNSCGVLLLGIFVMWGMRRIKNRRDR